MVGGRREGSAWAYGVSQYWARAYGVSQYARDHYAMSQDVPGSGRSTPAMQERALASRHMR